AGIFKNHRKAGFFTISSPRRVIVDGFCLSTGGKRHVQLLSMKRSINVGVRFGLRVPTQGRPQDTGAFAQQVEAAGFDFLWTPDTPLLAGRWRDVYVHLTCAALQTSRLRLGPGVTNP